MVLRYKALVAFALAIFVLVWWNGVEFFPLSSIPMYTKPALSSTVLYFRVLDAAGNVVNDNAAFFVAIHRSGDEVAAGTCFGSRPNTCHDYFSLIARWLEQPITVELWQWDYKTDERTRVTTVPINP